jgi:CRISPR/Cas system CSM-associated protein Csm2 small subunit
MLRLGDKMRITKRQLRRIIKEEKAKLHETTIRTMDPKVQEIISYLPEQVADAFGQQQLDFFYDHPQDFAGRSTEEEWKAQVFAAEEKMMEKVAESINRDIEEVETMLHNGEFALGSLR